MIVNPPCSSRSVTMRAYPIQVLIWHEIVNDTVGDEPLIVSFCLHMISRQEAFPAIVQQIVSATLISE